MAAAERLGIGTLRLLWASVSATHSSGKLQVNCKLANPLLVKYECQMGQLLVFVLTCLQDTSAPKPSSVHLAPRVVPSPDA
jgi:hypothetical protein